MVSAWLPDPPVGQSNDEISTVSVPATFLDSDTDDQEPNLANERLLENDGYRLLNDSDYPVDDETDDSEDDTSNNVSALPARTTSHDVNLDTYSPVASSSAVVEPNPCENDTRDIDVDYDQVRAAMSRITLPASAAPSWASNIPDSEWCNFLQDRIRTLQQRNDLYSEQKN